MRGAEFPSDIIIGDDSGIGLYANIQSGVTIGNYVMMGPNVSIYTINHSHELNGTPFCFQGNLPVKNVCIGDNVWIGEHVILLPGVVGGNNVIIGAGLVVTKQVPNNVIIGGNPAKILRKLE